MARGTLWSLFKKSPFGPVQEHMKKSAEAAMLVAELLEHLISGDQEQVRLLAKRISQAECEADEIKNSVRDHLPRSLFMPVARGDVIRMLSTQDAVADCAEDVGVLLTLRVMPVPSWLEQPLRDFGTGVLKCVSQADLIMAELDVLVEASFGGPEAERVLSMVDELNRMEHEADKLQDSIAKLIFAHEDDMKPVAVFMWSKIFNKLGDIANHAENVGDRIRMFVARA